MARRLLKILAVLLFIAFLLITITAISHPIVLKWLSGTARIIGKPVPATIYTNGQLNDSLQLFHVNKYWDRSAADYFVIYSGQKNRAISLNRKDNYAGLSVSGNKKNYDLVYGFLFQGETGSKFSLFQDDMKGYGVVPSLIFTETQISLISSRRIKELNCDSIRIVFR